MQAIKTHIHSRAFAPVHAQAHTHHHHQPTQTPVASFALNELIKMFSWENALAKPWVYCNET